MDDNVKWYQGEEFFHNLNLVLIFVVYTIVILTMMLGWNIWWTIIGTGFFIMLYIIIYVSYTKKKQLEDAGQLLLESWMDQVEDMGERVILPIKKITPHERLTPEELEDAKQYIKEQEERLKALELLSTEDIDTLDYAKAKELEDKSA